MTAPARAVPILAVSTDDYRYTRLTIYGDQLTETQLNVPRPWWHVNDERVEIPGW
jgi:hypothetical protein